MEKFEHVDVLDTLKRIMRQNTAFYQTDFDCDSLQMWRNIYSEDEAGKHLLWFSRPSGTVCFPEQDVFLKDTYPNHSWRFYGEQTNDRVLAYAVELAEHKDSRIYGNIYPLDYAAHWRRAAQDALRPDLVQVTFQNGDVRTFDYEEYNRERGMIQDHFGPVKEVKPLLREPERMAALLQREQGERDGAVLGNVELHIQKLRTEKIQLEAARLLSELQKPDAPNSPNGTHFIAEVSPYFLKIANGKDQDRLFNMLPFSTLSFSGLNDRRGIFAMISKDEDRDKPLRIRKPSVRQKLIEKADAPAAPRSSGKRKEKGPEL